MLRHGRDAIVKGPRVGRFLLGGDRGIIARVILRQNRDPQVRQEQSALDQIIHGEGECFFSIPHRDESAIECVGVRVEDCLQGKQRTAAGKPLHAFNHAVERFQLQVIAGRVVPNQASRGVGPK